MSGTILDTWNTFTEIQRIIRDYYKKLYATKLDNLKEMNKFLEIHNLSRLNLEELVNLNRPSINSEIESVIKRFPTKKRPEPNSFTGEVYQTFKEELILFPLNFKKKLKGRNTPKLVL